MGLSRNQLVQEIRHFAAYQTGVGAGLGKVFVVAEADSAYEALLKERGFREDTDFFHTIAAAYAATTASRNDTVLVYPGTYTQTAKVTWANSSTHLIGVGSPNQRIPATAGTTGCVYFPCATAMTEEFLITGHHCVFANFSTYLSTATGVADVRVTGRNTTLKNMFMKSGQDATQLASAVLGYALYCDGTAAGNCNGLRVEDCYIGDPRNTVRTAGGMIYMTGHASGGSGMCYHFKRNVIAGWSETAACSAVFETAFDRECIWEDCTFYNFYTNLGAILTSVITDTCGTTHMNLITGKTCQYGWGNWSTSKSYCFVGVPVSSGSGGVALVST